MWKTQTDWERQKQTAILIHNLFSWPYPTVLSSRPHLTLLFLSRGVLNRRSTVGGCPSGVLSVTTSWHWLKTLTDCNWLGHSHGHLHIYFYNAHYFRSTSWLLPLISTDASCSEKSLIDSSVKGQYATEYLIYWKWCQYTQSKNMDCYFNVYRTSGNLITPIKLNGISLKL